MVLVKMRTSPCRLQRGHMKNSALPWAVAAKSSLVKTCPSSLPLPPFIIPFVILDYNLLADSS